MFESLQDLFRRCLAAKYVHTTGDGDFCVETEGRTLYLLFEWSDGKTDWLNNMDFPATPYKHPARGEKWYCHRGFLRVWKGIRDEVAESVASELLRHPTVGEIVTVGYSHGAALALLATEDMVYHFGEKRVRGYGFGCPRVVFGRLPRPVAERFCGFTVVRNVPDLVTHVPPALFGFHHVGRMTEIGKGNGYRPIDAHTPEAYIRSLTELRNGAGNCSSRFSPCAGKVCRTAVKGAKATNRRP